MGKEFKDGEEGEFEVQALVYMGLLSMGYRVRGEVKSTLIFEGKRKRNARFDLVIFDDKWKPLEIIETKHPKYSIDFKDSSQYAHYKQYGVPVRFAMSMKTAFDLLDYYHGFRGPYEALYGLNEVSEKVSNFIGLLNY